MPNGFNTRREGLLKLFIREVSFPFFARRDGLGGIMDRLGELRESQFWPMERILDLQERRLKALLVHAYEHTAYYRGLFDLSGFNPYAFRHADELARIPALTKELIRDNLKDLVADTLGAHEIHAAETGGTSGVKMRFFRDNACLAMKQAAVHRFDSWAGWDVGERMGLVWPAGQDYLGGGTWKSRVRNAFYRRVIAYPAAVMDDGSSEAFIRELKRRRPAMVTAFTSPICELARYMVRTGAAGTTVKGVVSTGEPLYPHQRKLIEEAFGCLVFDSYRSREAGPMAQECGAHEGMHINAECLYVETVPRLGFMEGRPGAGAVLVTDLVNYGMPLIRYDMGDLGVMSGRACPCGRGLPLMENVAGRVADTFVTPQGRLIPTAALVLYLVDEAPGLMGQMQMVQDAPDHLTLRLTKDPMPSEGVLEHQKRMIEKLFGPGMRLTYEFVDRIPREGSGKYLFARRLIPGPGRG